MTREAITVVLASDQAMYPQGQCRILNSTADIRAAGEEKSGWELPRTCQELQPACSLSSIRSWLTP